MNTAKTFEDCPICYTCIDNDAIDGHKMGCITNCGHRFHLKCLHIWTYNQDHNECPYCRTNLDHDILDEQYTLRMLLRIKQRQPQNSMVDDILYQLKTERIKTLNWFCDIKSNKLRFYWTHKIPRVPEEKPKYIKKRGRLMNPQPRNRAIPKL